jgi:hypothetical protein
LKDVKPAKTQAKSSQFESSQASENVW